MPFAQLVIGPPGSGKSTYCDGMQQLLAAVERKCSIVNLDPANDQTSYAAALDVRDLVSLDEIMEAEELGPNGGVLYALEELEYNIEWLEEGLQELGDEYIIFDCPGQVELFTHHASLRNIFFRLQKLGYRLVVLHLMDSFTLTQPSLYISSLLLSLRAMLQMDLPHLNVLTKIDNLGSYPPLPLPLDFYTDVQSLEHLLPHLEQEQASSSSSSSFSSGGGGGSSHGAKFTKLNEAIIELIEEFALVSYVPLAVEDRSMMLNLLHEIDRAGGHVFVPSGPRLDGRGRADGADQSVWSVVMRESAPGKLDVRDIEERWAGPAREQYDELEREMWKVEGNIERRRVQDEAGRASEQQQQQHQEPMRRASGVSGSGGRSAGAASKRQQQQPEQPVAEARAKTKGAASDGAVDATKGEVASGTSVQADVEETEEEEYDRLEAEAIANATAAAASNSTSAAAISGGAAANTAAPSSPLLPSPSSLPSSVPASAPERAQRDTGIKIVRKPRN